MITEEQNEQITLATIRMVREMRMALWIIMTFGVMGTVTLIYTLYRMWVAS